MTPFRRLALCLSTLICATPLSAAVFVNELHYDDATTPSDIGERIEVVATAGEDLSQYSIVLYNGSNTPTAAPSYDTDPLTAGVLTSCSGGGSALISTLNYPSNGIQNGPTDGIALVGPGPTVVQFLSYEGVITASNGPAAGMTSIDIGVAETNATLAGTSLQLTGSGSAYADFTWAPSAAETVAACNNGQSFGAAVDNPPTVVSTVPANNAINVNAGNNLTIQFSEAVTTNAGWFALSCNAQNVTYTESGTGASRTIDPTTDLVSGASCTGSITAANVLDQDGTPDPMAANFSFSFTVQPDIAPTVTTTVPLNNATNVAPANNLSVSFSESVTTNPGWFALVCNTQAVTVVESGTGSMRTIDPASNLAFGASCTATITAANVLDLDGTPNAMASDVSFSFTVLPDAIPTVLTTLPANNASNVAATSNIQINFSEPVTVSGSWFAINCASSNGHPAIVSGGPQNYTLNPDVDFALLEQCTVSLTASLVLDQDGNPDPLASNFSFSFMTAGDASSYYNSVDASNATALRTTLNALIDDHTAFPYTASTTDTWDVLEAADQDPNNVNQVLDIYKNAVFPKAGGGNTNYNREHTWPNSLGFNDLSGLDTMGRPFSPYTDCHMLYISHIGYNSDRGNKPFANCSGCSERTTDVNNNSGGGSGVYPGNSNWVGGSDGNTGSFEVWGQRKGDAARAILYMDIRYEGGNAANGQPEPDLRLTNDRQLIQQTQTGVVAAIGYMGLLDTLLAWHEADPPSAQERLRNEVVFTFQGNRNPFIDHPEYAACLYQNQCGALPDPLFDDGFEGN